MAGVDVVVSQYCFAIYPIIAKLFGANPIVVPAKNYGHDLSAMLAAITPKTKVVFVANPNNPTGTLAPRAEVLKLVNEMPKNILLVMDEAYVEFLEDPVDLLPMIRGHEAPNLLIMRTFSKIFGLAGLRLGYGIAEPELIAALEKIRQPFNVNSIAQAGAIAALNDLAHVKNTRANNASGLRFLEENLRRLELEIVPSSANFILARVGDGQRVFNELQKRGVITRPLGGYLLPEWIRISVGTEAENRRSIQALEQVMAAK